MKVAVNQNVSIAILIQTDVSLRNTKKLIIFETLILHTLLLNAIEDRIVLIIELMQMIKNKPLFVNQGDI